jgi:uncharacterized protein YybS (DUF2232 family)
MNAGGNFAREYLLAGIWFVLLIALSLTPTCAPWVVWLFPVPVAVIYVVGSRGAAAVMAMIAGLDLAAVGFGWASILFALTIYVMAGVMGEALARRDSPYAALITATLVGTMLEIVLLAALRATGVNLYATLRDAVSQSLAADSRWLAGSDIEVQGLVGDFVTWLQTMLPAVLATLAFLVAAVNWLLCARLLRRCHPPTALLSRWQLPRSVVTVYLLAIVCLLLNLFSDWSLWSQTVRNALFLSGFFLGIQGLSYLWRRLERQRLRYLWLAFLVLAAGVKLVSDVYVLLGIYDILRVSRGTRV